MKKTNISHLCLTLSLGMLLIGCGGGGTEYDTAKDFTKLEANTDYGNTVTEEDRLAEQYRYEQSNKNIIPENFGVSSHNGDGTNTTPITETTNVNNVSTETIPLDNTTIATGVNLDNNNTNNNPNIQTVPQSEVNVISDSNATQ